MENSHFFFFSLRDPAFWRTLGKQSLHGQPGRCSPFLLVGRTFSRRGRFWTDEEGKGHSLPALLCSSVQRLRVGFFPLIKIRLAVGRTNVVSTNTKGIYLKDDRNQQDGPLHTDPSSKSPHPSKPSRGTSFFLEKPFSTCCSLVITSASGVSLNHSLYNQWGHFFYDQTVPSYII